jgi:2,4-diketo-3-deoxy-L-fuconate hydrolase
MTGSYALGTFSEAGESRWPGLIRDGEVIPLANLLSAAPGDLGSVFAEWSVWGERIDKAASNLPSEGWRSEADLVAHLPYKPENLFCAGANYRKHVIDLIVDQAPRPGESADKEERRKAATAMMDRRAAQGKPFVFVGVRSAIAGPDEPLVVPYDHTEPDWELEMAVVIGKPARRVSREQALSHVAGYTIANDVTARELVARPDIPQMGMDWMACKGAPGFKVLGPYITPAKFVSDPQALHIRLSLNGDVMQDEGTNDMIFDTAKIISFISNYVLLHPGDVILTGSPSGNGTHYGRFLRGGDVMKGEIDGLVGAQVVRCVAEQPRAAG